MKDVQYWTVEDILSLPQGEFDWLEGKGSRSIDISDPSVKIDQVRNLLSKAISAFANSGGGYLVLGVKDPCKGWGIDGGGIPTVLKNHPTREWLEDLIPHLVEPNLRSFNVYEVSSFDTPLHQIEGRAVYVIHIKESEQAPHQANDNVYYGRIGGKSRPLSHRFVMDILGRQKMPRFNAFASVKLHSKKSNSRPLTFFHPTSEAEIINHYCDLEFGVKNIGHVYAKYVNALIKIPHEWLGESDKESFSDSIEIINETRYITITKNNTRRDVVDVAGAGSEFMYYKYGPSWFSPILPGRSFTWEVKLDPAGFNANKNVTIIWSAHADNAGVQSGEIAADEIQVDRSNFLDNETHEN